MTLRLRLLSVAVTSVLSSNALACSSSTAPACAVTASPGRIVAEFPIVNRPFIWRWSRPETGDNDLEYRWQVEFGTCGADGRFSVGEYAYGVQLFKFPGSTARSGQLSALLDRAQHTFVHRQTADGRVVYSMVPGAHVESELAGSALKVTVAGPEPVAQLLAQLPKHALLTVNTPDKGGSYTCYAEVQYAQ